MGFSTFLALEIPILSLELELKDCSGAPSTRVPRSTGPGSRLCCIQAKDTRTEANDNFAASLLLLCLLDCFSHSPATTYLLFRILQHRLRAFCTNFTTDFSRKTQWNMPTTSYSDRELLFSQRNCFLL